MPLCLTLIWNSPLCHLVKFNWLSLRCIDGFVMTLLLPCSPFQMMLPEWCSRARRTTSMPAISRCASLILICVSCPCLTFNVNSSSVWVCVCMCVCLFLRWRPQRLVCVYVILRLKVHCRRLALTFGRLFGSNSHTPSSCLQL